VRVSKTLNFFLFFGLSFLISWLLWIPAVLKTFGNDIPDLFLFIGLFASFGPGLSSLILTAFFDGKEGLKKLFKSGIQVRFQKRMFLFIFLFPFGLMAVSWLILLFFEGNHFSSDFIKNPLTIIPAFFSILVMGGPLGEEFGWRGYALEKLLKKYSFFYSSLILGITHGLWHLPLFFIDSSVQFFIPFYEFLLPNTVNRVLRVAPPIPSFTPTYSKKQKEVFLLQFCFILQAIFLRGFSLFGKTGKADGFYFLLR